MRISKQDKHDIAYWLIFTALVAATGISYDAQGALNGLPFGFGFLAVALLIFKGKHIARAGVQALKFYARIR